MSKPGWGHKHDHEFVAVATIGAMTIERCSCGQRRHVIMISPLTSPVGGEAPGAPCTPTGHHITARDGGARGVVDPEASPDPAPVGRVSTPTGAPSQGGAA